MDESKPAEQMPLFDAEPYYVQPETSRHKERRDVRAVFDHWVQAAGKTSTTKLDAKREKLIKKALSQYPLEDVLDAVVGWKRSDFHTGNNDHGRVYSRIELLLRDAAHIEMFRDMERSHGEQHETAKKVNVRQL